MTIQPVTTPWPGISEPVPNANLRVLSLGAGVQSTTLALLAANGLIDPIPDVAIFADTGWEQRAVYDHLDWLENDAALPFPIHRIQGMDLRQQTLDHAEANTGRYISVPYFVSSGGMERRQCTREAKIAPIRAEIRRLLGLKKGERATGYQVEQWIGISTDEMQRMSRSRDTWITNRWPLVEARMSRQDCLSWLEQHGYPEPPKSACIGCPFHSDAFWSDMLTDDPAAFDDAVRVDAALRSNGTARGMKSHEFMHRSCRPLADLPFTSRCADQPSFLDECDGICGT